MQLTPVPDGPPAPTPALPTPSADSDNGGRIDPIEAEPLAAPPVPPPAPAPPPALIPAPDKGKGGDHAAIKGILDRLDDGSPPKPANTQDKPAPPEDEPPADDEPVKP